MTSRLYASTSHAQRAKRVSRNCESVSGIACDYMSGTTVRSCRRACSCALELKRAIENDGEGHEPDEIVGDVEPAHAQRPAAAAERRLQEADGAEELAEEADEHDGPVAKRIARGDPIPDA